MSSASALLDALLSETDDDVGSTQYSIEDALNDPSDFKVETLATSTATPEAASSSSAVAATPDSAVAKPSSAPPVDNSVKPAPLAVESATVSPANATPKATEPKLNKAVLAEAMRETADLELTPSANVNIDKLVKSIITDKSEGVQDVKLMQKLKEYEQNLMNVEDSKRLLKTLEERRRKRELNSSILQITQLEKIGVQITSPQFKKTGGTPTCIAASAKFIAVGTSHGVTMIFDHFQTLKMVIGMTDGIEYGRVYSVGISFDSEWVIVGHHLGQVVIWDLLAAKPVKVLTNEAPVGLETRTNVPVIFVDFVEAKKTRFIALSLDGVLNVHNLTRVFLVTMVDTNYILTGQSGSGSVIAVAPLPPDPQAAHPVDVHCLIACATFKRIVVFPTADKTSVIYHLKRPDNIREGALPYLAWRELISTSQKNGQTKLLDPVLAVAWGTSIVITQIIQSLTDANGLPVDPTDVKSLIFRKVAAYSTDTEVTSIHWLGTGVIVFTTASDELRVLDPFSVEEIEIDSIKHVELAYHTKFSGTKATTIGTDSGASSSTFNNPPMAFNEPARSASGRTSTNGASPSASGHSSANGTPPPARKSKAMPVPKDILEAEKRLQPQKPSVSNRDQTLSQSFHASVCAHRGKLFIMGIKSPFVAIVLGWSERISAMVEKGRWLDALALSLDFYHGRAKAVKGLPRDPAKAAAKIGARIEQLLYDYVKTNLSIALPKDPTHFDMVATVCIDYCLLLGRVDILFQLLYPLFQGRKKASLLLEKLEPFILGDKLSALPPEVIQQIVKHYVSHPQLIPKLEQILLHLDLGLLDFHSVVNLCIKHHLSTALFHLYIDGLQDYITPMDHLMKVLVKDLDLSNQFTTPEMRELKRTIGYKLILYLSFIFKGKSFPSEVKLPARKVEELRELILDYLLVPKLGGDLAGERYPRIRVLLSTDSHELLNVLRSGLDGISHPKRLIQITDILVELMVDPGQAAGKQHSLFWSDKPNPSWPFTPAQVAELYHFVAHYYSSGTLDISDDLLQRITGYTLLSSDGNADKREKLLLDVLRSCPEEKLEYQKLALLAESAKFYKVCDFFFTHRRDYGAVIRCHILDPVYRKSIFSFVRTLMYSTDPSNPKILPKRSSTSEDSSDPRFVAYMLTDREKEDVKRACIEKITDLIRIDSERTANLVMNVLHCDQAQVMKLLDPYPEIQLSYLKSCLLIGRDPAFASLATAGATVPAQPFPGVPTKRNASKSASNSDPQVTVRPPLDMATGEKLLELLCRFEPKSVPKWLKENESIYRLDAAIEITKHFKIWEAYVTLQETAGDMAEVLRILMVPVQDSLTHLYGATLNTTLAPPYGISGVLPTQEAEEMVQEVIDVAVSFCKRNHRRMEASESQAMWFRILDEVMHPLGEVELRLSGKPSKSQERNSTRFQGRSTNDLELLKYHLNKLMSRILDAMVGYVDLQAVLEKILNESVDSKVADFRDIFVRLLENYTHERNILRAAVEVMRYDTHQQFAQLVRRKQKGVSGRHLTVTNTSREAGLESGTSMDGDDTTRAEAYPAVQEASRLQILRDLDSGATRKTRHELEPNTIRRDQLASMRNIQLQPTVPGAMPTYSLFHSVIKLDDTPPRR